MPEPRGSITSFGWTSRLFRKEFLFLGIVLVLIVVVGLINVTIHGEHARGGVNAVGTTPVVQTRPDR